MPITTVVPDSNSEGSTTWEPKMKHRFLVEFESDIFKNM